MNKYTTDKVLWLIIMVVSAVVLLLIHFTAIDNHANALEGKYGTAFVVMVIIFVGSSIEFGLVRLSQKIQEIKDELDG